MDADGFVRHAQTRLAAAGYYAGIVDGDPGPMTRGALDAVLRAAQGGFAPPPPAEPAWLVAARKYLDLTEIKGVRHHPQILKWFEAIGAGWFTDDETPWCAAFVGGVLEEVGMRSSRSAAARSYLGWGEAVSAATLGCIVVFERGPAAGHVGFLVGHDGAGRLMVLGGNQSDAVNIRAFDRGRLLGYRWPAGIARPTVGLPLIGGGKISIGEA